MGGRFIKGQSFTTEQINEKFKCQFIDSNSQALYKTLAYLEQIRHLVKTKEISGLPAGRGIVIAPRRSQPQNDLVSNLQEKLILSVKGDLFKSQGNIDQIEDILTRLIQSIKDYYLQDKISYSSPKHKLKVMKELAELIFLARKKIRENFSPCLNREKIDTYLHTLEINLRYYDFFQKGGIYYLGKDNNCSDKAQTKVLTKNSLAAIDSIHVAEVQPKEGQLFTLYKKGKIKEHAYVSAQSAQCISKSELGRFLSERGLTLSVAQKADTQQTKKYLLKLFMTQEFEDIDTVHKVWVNSAPSNNPCAHELLMLSAGGRVKGYANIDAFHDVVSYIPKDEFDDYLRKNNRTVMGIQPLPIKNIPAFKYKLAEYIEKKWLAAGFFHNCANFADEISHSGGVSYSRLNPIYSGDYHHVQYPINRLQALKELGALHPHGVNPESDTLKSHIKSAKEEFRQEAIKDSIREKKCRDYIHYRAYEGLPHEKAKQKVAASPAASFNVLGLITQFACLLNPVIFLNLIFYPESNKSIFGLFSHSGTRENQDKDIPKHPTFSKIKAGLEINLPTQ